MWKKGILTVFAVVVMNSVGFANPFEPTEYWQGNENYVVINNHFGETGRLDITSIVKKEIINYQHDKGEKYDAIFYDTNGNTWLVTICFYHNPSDDYGTIEIKPYETEERTLDNSYYGKLNEGSKLHKNLLYTMKDFV